MSINKKNNISSYNNSIVYYLFVISIIFGDVFYQLINFDYIDEITVLILTIYYIIKKIRQKNIEKEFIIFCSITLFYLCYSLFLNLTSTIAIITDLQQEVKPFLIYYSINGLRPRIDEYHSKRIKLISFILSIFVLITIVLGISGKVFGIPANLATICLCLSYTYYYFSHRNKKDLIIMIIILSIGLFSGRSKFFGEYVLTIIILLGLKAKLKLNFKYIIFFIILIASVTYISWHKINYYFIEGEQTEARPILYKNACDIIYRYFPFGSGYGTFGNEAARKYYSPLYRYYKMNYVWGLSEEMGDFLTDTYYPILAQFGICGIILFIIFWKRRIKTLNNNLNIDNDIYSYKIGLMIILSILIECIADTSLLSNRGVPLMMLLSFTLTDYKYKQRSTIIKYERLKSKSNRILSSSISPHSRK
jgi:hypothetical protein